jgi:hypothetical protein
MLAARSRFGSVVLLGSLIFLVAPASARADDKPKVPRVEVDTSEVPELKDWGEKSKVLVEKWYPRVAAYLASPDYAPPDRVRIVFRKEMRGVAYTSGNRIVIAADWVKKHPDDWGMVIHEMTHVIQSYRGASPGWLVEGIADYVRLYRYEPKSPRPRVNPRRASYRDGYRTTAAFLAWATQRYDKELVPALNRALRERSYSDALFQKRTGKGLDELWKEFVGTLPGRP